MKKCLNFILTILFVAHGACFQTTSHKIIGRWLYKGTENNKTKALECPDMLIFNGDGSYLILNDCYGVNYDNPVVEQGKWTLNTKGNVIILKDRKFTTNYALHDTSQGMTMHLKECTGESLKICFYQGSCIAEEYEKLTKANKDL